MLVFQSWLTLKPPVIRTANTALSTAAKSMFVGIHSWQAVDTNISYRYLFIRHCQRWWRAHFSRSLSVCQPADSSSRSSHRQCLFSNPSRLNSSATAWTQLSDAFILFCGSAAAMVGWLICRETLLPARRSQSKTGQNDGSLSECRIYRRINLSLLLTVTASPLDLSCLPGSLGAAESMKICCP